MKVKTVSPGTGVDKLARAGLCCWQLLGRLAACRKHGVLRHLNMARIVLELKALLVCDLLFAMVRGCHCAASQDHG